MSSLPPPYTSTSGNPGPGGRRPGEVQDARTSRATLAILAIAVIAVVVLVGAVVMIVAGAEDDTGPSVDGPASSAATDETATSAPADPTPQDPTGYGTGDCPPPDRPDRPVRTFTDAPRLCIDPAQDLRAVVETDRGSFTITLDVDDSPITVNNFVTLARWGYYDRTGCHRVIAEFVLQCGRPGSDETAPGYSIPDELPAAGEYENGVVAMANTGAPDTGGGQWFVITGPDGAALPPQYSIVGRVTKGYRSTVQALADLADPKAPNGVPPKEPIRIRSVQILEG